MPKTQTLLSIVATIAVAALIGCGGGGGGGGTTGITTSSNSSAGTNATSGNNGGVTNGTGATAGTTGAPGTIPANVVFYSEDVVQGTSSQTQVRRINPDGTGDFLYVSLPEAFQGLGLNPNVGDEVLFGFSPNNDGNYGLFRNSRVTGEGATTIVSPRYTSISSISVTPDGATAVFVATPSDGPSGLYTVSMTGGTPLRLDEADDAALSPSGNLVAYSSLRGAGTADIYVKDLRQPTANPARITNNSIEDVMPNWSRSGARLVFSRQVSDTNYDLFAVDASNGGNEALITSTANQSEFGASYSGDDAQVSFAVLSANDPAENGLFRQEAKANSAATRFRIKASPSIREDTHWTNFNGRAKHRAVGNLALRTKKRTKPAESAVK